MMNPKLAQIPEIVGKEVDERISRIQTKLLKTMEVEKELMELEIMCSLLVKPQRKIHKLIKQERKKVWKEALSRAKGDREKAIEIFDELYLK